MILKIIRNVKPIYIYRKRCNFHETHGFFLGSARSLFIGLISIFIISCAPSERLNVSQSTVHPWYWAHGNRTVLLLGASDDDNLFQWSEDDLNNQLDRLVRAGGNFMRNTMSDRKEVGFEVYPFHEIQDDIYDLNKWNEDYWIRFERLLVETEKRDIVVQIDIWDHYDFTGSTNFSEEGHWQAHPYNPKNNINYDLDESSFVVS